MIISNMTIDFAFGCWHWLPLSPHCWRPIPFFVIPTQLIKMLRNMAIWFVLLALISKTALALSPMERASQCALDSDCHGILVNDDDESAKISTSILPMALVNPDLIWKTASQGTSIMVTELKQIPESISSNHKSKALELGFDKKVTYNMNGIQLTKFYKVFKDQAKTYFPAIEQECLNSHGIMPVANMTEQGLMLLYKTLVPDALVLPIGLRKYLVSGSNYRLTWTNGVVLGEGTKAEYDAMLLRDFGLVDKQPDEDTTRFYGYIEGRSMKNEAKMMKLPKPISCFTFSRRSVFHKN